MRNLVLNILIILSPIILYSNEKIDFDYYFIDQTMRIDYFHIGDAEEEVFTIDHIYQQGIWAGNPDNLIDSFINGRYFIKIYDTAANRLIFSKGYDSYFGEYKTTEPAKKGVKRAFHESTLIPYPRKPILFVIEVRDKKNILHPSFIREIDPDDYHIIRELPQRGDKVYEMVKSGNPHKKVDLVLIGEGYTAKDKGKFKKDLKKYTDVFFNTEPYKSNKDKFNVYGIFSTSLESGVDEPRQKSYKNSALGASFNALDTPRYLLTEDNKTLRDIAAQTPYDAVYIMVNSERYGGGGIYNFFGIFTANEGQWNEHVFLHEFGHSFAGLADEYYTSNVAYDEFYPKGAEPTEPNITALMDPDNLKWKDLVTPGIDIPTEWAKDEFDSLNMAVLSIRREMSERLKQMRKEGASEKEIGEVKQQFDDQVEKTRSKVTKFILEHPARCKIGAFEGAGYKSTGLYRPTLNSIMHVFNNEDKYFYKVNEQAIINRIKYYSE